MEIRDFKPCLACKGTGEVTRRFRIPGSTVTFTEFVPCFVCEGLGQQETAFGLLRRLLRGHEETEADRTAERGDDTMSWWVYVVRGEGEDASAVKVEPHTEGGTYAIGGIETAELNITYNYGRIFKDTLGRPFRSLDGLGVEEAIPLLEGAVGKLGTAASEDYWAATEGNAGYALNILLAWCRQERDKGLGARIRVS